MAMCGRCAEAWKVGHKCDSGQAEIYRGIRHFLPDTSSDTGPETLKNQSVEPQGVAHGTFQKNESGAVLGTLVRTLRKACFAVDRHSEKCKSCGKRRDRGTKGLGAYEPYRPCRKAAGLEREEKAAATAVRKHEEAEC